MPILSLCRQHAEWCEPAKRPEPVYHPDDDVVLTTALAGGAEAVVTGDADCVILGTYPGIEVISPREFVARQIRIATERFEKREGVALRDAECTGNDVALPALGQEPREERPALVLLEPLLLFGQRKRDGRT